VEELATPGRVGQRLECLQERARASSVRGRPEVQRAATPVVVRRTRIIRDLSEHDQIVVSGTGRVRALPHDRRALVGTRPVADHVPRHQISSKPPVSTSASNCFERMQVRE
jgi:hypothetical protein